MDPKDILYNHYKNCEVRKLPEPPKYEYDVTFSYGLKVGEFFMLTAFNKAAWEQRSDFLFDVHPENPIADELRPFLTDFYRKPLKGAKWKEFHWFVENFDCGNGNIIQQTYRAFDLEPDIKPKGLIERVAVKVKNRIGLHLEGYTAGHTGLRSLKPENVDIIRNFIKSNPQFEFVEFGLNRNFPEARDFTKTDLNKTVKDVGTCEYMICINSGLMHVAACYDIKLITIIDLPRIDCCYFPIIKNQNPLCRPPYDTYDAYWLYPQSVHLHQSGENELVPRLSVHSLDAAVKGGVYPYWNDKYLNMINM